MFIEKNSSYLKLLVEFLKYNICDELSSVHWNKAFLAEHADELPLGDAG